MRLRQALVVLVALVGAAAVYLYAIQRTPKLAEQPPTGAVDARTQRDIDRLKTFDPERYAQAAAAANDFRHVHIGSVWRGGGTPGIACLGELHEPRRLFFGDVRYAGLDELENGLADAAKRFNTALLRMPNYPDKDVCILVDKGMSTSDVAEITRAADRKPMIVDLATAVRAQDLPAAQRFLTAGTDVNGVDRWQSTPLMWAIRRKNRPTFDALLAAGADIYKSGGVGSSPLTVATEVGDVPFLRAVLEAGSQRTKANPKPKGWRDSTNIHVGTVISLNRIDLLDLLLEYEAVPGPDGAWEHPLSLAMESNCVACIEKILAFGGPKLSGSDTVFKLLTAELEREPQRELLMPLARAALPAISYSPNATGALRSAIDGNQRRALRYLLLNAQNVNFLTSTEARELAAAAVADDDKSMSALVATAAQRRRAVDDAIRRSDNGALRKLITKQTLEQNYTLTPLMLAAKVGAPETIRTLIEFGADIEARIGHRTSSGGYSEAETNDATALYLAISAANLETTRSLLDEGADLNATIGWRPLLADAGGLLGKQSDQTWSRFVDLFMEKTPASHRKAAADTLLNSDNGASASRMQLLFSYGADSCAPGLYDNALANAVSAGSFKTYETLLEHCRLWQSDQSLQKHTLAKALDALSYEFDDAVDQEKIALDLLRRKVPLPDDFEQRSYLCEFARRGSIALIEALVAAGAKINAIDYDRTALDCVRKEDASGRAKLRKMGAKAFSEFGVKAPEAPFPF